MFVTVSIVVHNTPREQLDKALECVLRSDNVKKIYVLDNGENRGEKKIFSDERIKYQPINNNGFGAGHNEGMLAREKEFGGKGYHLVMNADVCWDGDIIRDLVKYMDEHPEVGLVMPKVYYPDGDLQYACRMLPTPFDVFAKRFLPQGFVRKRIERYLLAGHDHDRPLNCPYLLGSFLFFRASVLNEIGGFDERFFMYPEDIDITRRIHRKYKTMYWPGVSLIHEHKAASRKSCKMLWIHTINMIKYFNKWGWWADPERREFNRNLLKAVFPLSSDKRQEGRG